MVRVSNVAGIGGGPADSIYMIQSKYSIYRFLKQHSKPAGIFLEVIIR